MFLPMCRGNLDSRDHRPVDFKIGMDLSQQGVNFEAAQQLHAPVNKTIIDSGIA